MFSLSKILFLILVVGAVWYGWRWWNRIQSVQQERMRDKRRDAPARPGPSAASFSTAQRTDSEDMEKCPECGAYVAPRSAVSCGRPACPYGR